MELHLLDVNLKDDLVIDVFKSLIWTERYCGYGDFELVLSDNTRIINSRAEDHYLSLKGSDRLMIIEASNTHRAVDSGKTRLIKGRALESILLRRIIWDQTILTGSFQDAIHQLLTENAIDSSIPLRNISRLIFEASNDPAITSLTIDAQYFGDNLYKVIKELCLSAGIGFKITLNDDNQFVFKLYAGVDRSYNQFDNSYVIFQPSFENLIESDYSDNKMGLKNVTLVAGEGEGANRITTEVRGSTIPGLDFQFADLSRREMFTDSSISKTVDGGTLTDPEYLEQLTKEGAVDLAEHDFLKSFEGEADTTNMYTFGVDFFMGDIVEITDEDGNETSSRVTELIRSEDASGLRVYPTFSSNI